MSIAHVWPQAEPVASAIAGNEDGFTLPEAADPGAMLLPDAMSLVASLAPELSRLFGYRIGLKVVAAGRDAEGRPFGSGPAGAGLTEVGLAEVMLAEVGRLTVPAQGGQSGGVFVLAVDRASLSRLLDRMFGARPEAGEPVDGLAGLPPQSGSWLSLARLMGEGLARALQSTLQITGHELSLHFL